MSGYGKTLKNLFVSGFNRIRRNIRSNDYNKIISSFDRKLPYLSFIVSTSALLFQITVLYPWHNKLDKDYDMLKDVVIKKLK